MSKVLPLTQAQIGLLDAQLLAPENPAFIIGEYVELRGPIDARAFLRVIEQVVGETEAERIRVIWTDEGPRQIVLEESSVPVELVDLEGESSGAHHAIDLMSRDLETPIDVTRESLCRHVLYRIGAEHHLWYHRAHHLALDGYAFALFAQRVAELYTAFTRGSAAPVASAATLEEVVADDLRYQAGEQCGVDRAFWSTRLDDIAQVPTFTDRLALPGAKPLRVERSLGAELTGELTAAATAARVNWTDLVLASVAIHLARYSSSESVVLGVPFMNRLGSVAFAVPCTVLNAFALPVQIEPEETVAGIARQIATFLRHARPHGRYRYEQLRRDLGLLGGERRLFGPVVNLMPFDYSYRFGDAQSTVHNLTPGPVEDIAFDVYHRSDGRGAILSIDANPHRYDPDEVEQVAAAFMGLIEHIATDPHAVVRELAREVVELDSPRLLTPIRDCLELIREAAAGEPNAVAVVDSDGGRVLTRRELVEQFDGRAAQLRSAGIGRGDVVAFLPAGGARDLVTILGIQNAGASYLALDQRYSIAQMGRSVDLAGARALLHSEEAAGRAREIAQGRADLRPLDPERIVPAVYEGLSEQERKSDSDSAYVVFTSGSSGEPKAVSISRRALDSFTAGARQSYGIIASDRILQFGSLHADASVEEIFVSLTAGATLVCCPPAARTSLRVLLDFCEREQVTVLDLPTALWHELVSALHAELIRLPVSVRLVIIGGEAASALRARQFLEAAPQVRLLNTYGPTETTVVATSYEVTRDEADEEYVPIGTVMPGVRGFVEYDRLSAVPTAGELVIAGPTVAEGYLGNIGDPRFTEYESGGDSLRCFRTGDLVSLSRDRVIRYRGRIDDQVKISGYRVSIRAVEEALRHVSGVSEGVVLVGGESSPSASLTIVLVAEQQRPSQEVVREAVAQCIRVQSVGLAVHFVDSLPRTVSGKIDRKAIHELVSSAVDVGHPGQEWEGVFTAIWREVLGRSDVSASDDFFVLGGTSLQTIMVANRLGIACGFDVPVELIFANPTPRGLARAIRHSRSAGPDHPRRSSRMDSIRGDLENLSRALLPNRSTRVERDGRHILLTGVTGFVGSRVLAALLEKDASLKVSVLVRALDTEQVEQRFLADCERDGKSVSLFRSSFRDRVRIVQGDLSHSDLGVAPDVWERLSIEVSDVVNCAAVVSALRGYESIRGVNVVAVAKLLRLCAVGVPAAFHQISTLAVSAGTSSPGVLADPFCFTDGYSVSKCVAEHLVSTVGRASGIPTSISRLGRVLGSATGGPQNPADVLVGVVAAARSVTAFPSVDLMESLSSVDEVASRIADVVLTPSAGGRVVEIRPESPARFVDVIEKMHPAEYPVPWVSLPQWQTLVTGCHTLSPETKALAVAWGEAVENQRSGGIGGVRPSDRFETSRGVDIVLTPEIDRAALRRVLDFTLDREGVR